MILVDYCREYYAPHLRTQVWAHMVSDASDSELHDFAADLPEYCAFWHRNHYDLTERGLQQALQRGAIQVSTRELVRRRSKVRGILANACLR